MESGRSCHICIFQIVEEDILCKFLRDDSDDDEGDKRHLLSTDYVTATNLSILYEISPVALPLTNISGDYY